MARPRKHDYNDIAQQLLGYVDRTEIPIIAEFCYQNDIRRQYLYHMSEKNQELSDAIKKAIDKKEAQLEIKSLKGEINSTQAIFSLKQLGWKDRSEIDQNIGSKDNQPFSVEIKVIE